MTTQPMSVKLTKKILLAAPEGAYLVSNCFHGYTTASIFEEIVAPPLDRENQGKRRGLTSGFAESLVRSWNTWFGFRRPSRHRPRTSFEPRQGPVPPKGGGSYLPQEAWWRSARLGTCLRAGSGPLVRRALQCQSGTVGTV